MVNVLAARRTILTSLLTIPWPPRRACRRAIHCRTPYHATSSPPVQAREPAKANSVCVALQWRMQLHNLMVGSIALRGNGTVGLRLHAGVTGRKADKYGSRTYDHASRLGTLPAWNAALLRYLDGPFKLECQHVPSAGIVEAAHPDGLLSANGLA